MSIRGIVGEVGQIEQPLSAATALANVSGGFERYQPVLEPAPIVTLSTLYSVWLGGSVTGTLRT